MSFCSSGERAGQNDGPLSLPDKVTCKVEEWPSLLTTSKSQVPSSEDTCNPQAWPAQPGLLLAFRKAFTTTMQRLSGAEGTGWGAQEERCRRSSQGKFAFGLAKGGRRERVRQASFQASLLGIVPRKVDVLSVILGGGQALEEEVAEVMLGDDSGPA